MSSATRRGGIPGPESRTGLTRPAMTEAEFERRQQTSTATAAPVVEPPLYDPTPPIESDPPGRSPRTRAAPSSL